MAEFSWPWQGDSVGDAASAPWDEDTLADYLRYLLSSEGVILGYENELYVTHPSGLIIRTATGGACIYGSPYTSDANVDQTLNSPPGSLNDYYRIVLRKSWSGKTVRNTLLGPTNAASPSWPSITQTPGTTWDTVLAHVTQTSGGSITVEDQRPFINSGFKHSPRIHFRNGDRSSYIWSQSSKFVHNGFYSDIIDVHHTCKFQCGTMIWSGSAASSGSATINYPIQFAHVPSLIVTLVDTVPDISIAVDTDRASTRPVTQGYIRWLDLNSNTHTTLYFYWMAFGAIVGLT